MKLGQFLYQFFADHFSKNDNDHGPSFLGLIGIKKLVKQTSDLFRYPINLQ